MDDRERTREDSVIAAARPAPPGTEFTTVKQTAEYLNVSPSVIYRLCVTRRLSHYKFGEGGGAIRINRTELMEFVSKCRVEERSEWYPARVERRRNRSQVRVYKHLDLREEHLCGAMTRAGSPCTLRTKDQRCHLHRRSGQVIKRGGA